jgi:macrolide-specific efflux system membrane fusion protein
VGSVRKWQNIVVDALPDAKLSGTVSRIAAASVDANKDTTTGGATTVSTDAVVKYEVEVKISAPVKELRSGMSAKVSIPLSEKKSVVSVPSDYIKRKDGRITVLVVKKGEEPEEREVELGAAAGTMIQIKTGLGEGDLIQKPTYEGPARKGFVGGGGG